MHLFFPHLKPGGQQKSPQQVEPSPKEQHLFLQQVPLPKHAFGQEHQYLSILFITFFKRGLVMNFG